MVQRLMNHFSFDNGKEQLKTLLFDKVGVSFILNPQLDIYLAVNAIGGQDLARIHLAKAVITFDEESGVEKWFYDGYGKRIKEKDADSKVVHKTEHFREKFQKWFSEIKEERYEEIHNKLTYVLVDEERAKQIQTTRNFTSKIVLDSEGVTNAEERDQLARMGLEVQVQEWI